MLAHYSQDEALLKAFEEGQDLHILTGAAFARVSYDELYEKYHAGDDWAKAMRMLGKTGNFALTYGMGAIKFQRYLLVNNKYEVSIDQADQWIKGYNEMYKGATEWKRRVMSYARRHGYVLTIKGRKRRLVGIQAPQERIRARAERQGVNACIQGSVGDVIAESMPYVQQMMASLGGTLLLQVHDELVGEVPEKHSALAASLTEQLMVGFINPILRCPQVADAHIGKSWAEAKG